MNDDQLSAILIREIEKYEKMSKAPEPLPAEQIRALAVIVKLLEARRSVKPEDLDVRELEAVLRGETI